MHNYNYENFSRRGTRDSIPRFFCLLHCWIGGCRLKDGMVMTMAVVCIQHDRFEIKDCLVLRSCRPDAEAWAVS